MQTLLKQAMERTLATHKVSMTDYAKRLGIGVSALSLKLDGKRPLRTEELQDISIFLGQSMEVVLWLLDL